MQVRTNYLHGALFERISSSFFRHRAPLPMLYMLSCLVITLSCLIGLFSHMNRLIEHVQSNETSRPSPLTTLILGLMLFATSAPIALTILSDQTMTLDASYGRLSVQLLAMGGAAAVGWGVWKLYFAYKVQSAGFWNAGHIILLMTAGGVCMISAAEHLSFYRSSSDGWANLELIKEISPISDMKNCNASIVLVRNSDSGAIEYRCPTIMIVNRHSSQPFVPWPDYTEGSSQQLGDAIRDIKSQATVPDQ